MKTRYDGIKKYSLGQYFTTIDTVKRVIKVLDDYTNLQSDIKILEPSSGTGNFITILKQKGFIHIDGCEIDPGLTKTPSDFFDLPLDKKFDLIIGNPPFTKYNLKDSYYYSKKYIKSAVNPEKYLTSSMIRKDKIQIENAFILKSIKHLRDENSTIAFVLPISFFIAKKNREIKRILSTKFSTIIIYQNDKKWFDYPIPCCFAIFTNNKGYKNKIVLLYEDGGRVNELLDISKLSTEELIPKSYLYKKSNNIKGIPLSKFISNDKIIYKKSYIENNISGSNIIDMNRIPKNKDIRDYQLAIVRVGNSSVGRAGLINVKEDILNDMFYVFKFKEEFNDKKNLKEKICSLMNYNHEYFKNITYRVGSKSIKRDEVLDFKMKI